MVDVIPGATYYDHTFGHTFVCNGCFTDDNGDRIVKLEYDGVDGIISLKYEIFRSDESLELLTQPM